MQLVTRALAVMLFSVFAVTAPRCAYADAKVAYVDLQRALEKSQAGAKAEKEYKEQVDKAQGKLDKQKESFDKSKGDFEKQVGSLSAEAKASKQEKLIQMEKDLKREFHDSQETLQRTNAKLVSGLVKDIREIVKKIGEDKGYTVILEKGNPAVLYADSGVDITDKVVEEFDKNAPRK